MFSDSTKVGEDQTAKRKRLSLFHLNCSYNPWKRAWNILSSDASSPIHACKKL
jgi:hypothetical protein